MRVLLVDDHRIMRDGLRAILTREPDVEVVGEAADGREAVTQAVALGPDIVVMDISMGGLNGLDATRRVLEARPKTRVICLSMHSDRRYVHAMFEAGAVGYLLKNVAAAELIQALRVVSRGQTYVSPAVADVVVEGLRSEGASGPSPPLALTARERELLQLLAEGLTSKEAAARMGIAVSTVETYRKQIMDKLGLRSVAELTKYALRHGITSLD